MRQMNRRLAPDNPSRTLWAWVKRFDWADELAAMACRRSSTGAARTGDKPAGLRRAQQLLRVNDVEFVEYPGLGHEAGGDPAMLADLVVPIVVDWAARRLGPPWQLSPRSC